MCSSNIFLLKSEEYWTKITVFRISAVCQKKLSDTFQKTLQCLPSTSIFKATEETCFVMLDYLTLTHNLKKHNVYSTVQKKSIHCH